MVLRSELLRVEGTHGVVMIEEGQLSSSHGLMVGYMGLNGWEKCSCSRLLCHVKVTAVHSAAEDFAIGSISINLPYFTHRANSNIRFCFDSYFYNG